MIQCLKSDNIMPEMLSYDGIVADDKRVWIIVAGFNVLLGIERETGKIFLCKLVSQYSGYKDTYRFLFTHNDKLVLIPYEEKDICIYDIKEDKFEHIELDMTKLKGDDAWKFSGYAKFKNKVVLYGVHSLILIIDLLSFEITYLDLKEQLPKDLKIEFWFWEYSCSKDDKLFLVPLTYPCIIELDMCKGNVQYYEIPEKDDVYLDNPIFNHGVLYYIGRKKVQGKVFLAEYNLEAEKLEKYDLGIEKKAESYRTFGFISCVDDVLWMLPGVCNDGYKFHISEKKIEKLKDLPKISEDNLRNTFPYEFNYRNAYMDDKGHIVAVHAWTCQLVDIDTIKEKISIIPICVDSGIQWSEVLDEMYCGCSHKLHIEWMDWMLELYIDKVICAGQEGKDEVQDIVGNNIYKKVKEEL